MRIRRIIFVGLLAGLLLGASDGYRRSDWPHWIAGPGDCQDTRVKVLVRDSRQPVLWRENDRENKHCQVAWGEWEDPWSGEILHDPEKIDIDHQVPLAEAHRSGGDRWDRARRRAFANDLDFRGHLRATSATTNRSKADKGPDRWRPPQRERWCDYARDWSAIKSSWGLRTSEPERLALRDLLKTCGNPSARTLFD